MLDEELWRRLQAFDFDDPSAEEPFSAKLARSEAWTGDYTARVIEEYRRFVYLTQVSEGPMTPSEVIDLVWHMHLTFTHSYWDEMCGGVLGAKLHHHPAKGPSELDRYEAQYKATLKLYRKEFGEKPPRDIWRKIPERPLSAIVGLGFSLCLFAAIAGYIMDLGALASLGVLGLATLFVLAAMINAERRSNRPTSHKPRSRWSVERDSDGDGGGCGD